MAEKDILNPKRGYDPELGDSMNPNQGWQRSRTSTLAVAKPSGGKPWSREVANDGVTFRLDWKRRNLKVTERLHRFFNEFEQGFFTFVDHDSGRQYVGHFVGEEPQSFDVNGRFSSSGWTFQEVPGCSMLEYPADFDRWGIKIYPVDDYGDAYAYCAAADVTRPWSQPIYVDGDGNNVTLRQVAIPATTAGDQVSFEYRGYGLRLFCVMGPSYGIMDVLLDGTNIGTIDCYADGLTGPVIVLAKTDVPLDLHRVELVSKGTKNEASAGTMLTFDHVEVIR